MRNNLQKKYFEWMYDTVSSNRYDGNITYRKLLTYLHSVDYRWLIPKDVNRAEDGAEGLRWTFAYEQHMNVSDSLDGPCSVLEMILALAYRCEEIMDDAAIGNRTVQWFWRMITNLGLGCMTDDHFDIGYVESVVERFLNREYEPDGHGSLFVIPNCEYDLRDVETWSSMLWYLDTIT